jgi:hypothetical protein
MVCSWLTVDDACSYFVLMESSALDLLPTKWTGRLRRPDSDCPRLTWFCGRRNLCWGCASMPIYRLLQNSPLGPEEIAVLADAYERTLRKLGLIDRGDPIAELIARKVIELGQRGVRDPKQLSSLAIKELGVE